MRLVLCCWAVLAEQVTPSLMLLALMPSYGSLRERACVCDAK